MPAPLSANRPGFGPPRQANATVFAPEITSSTTFAAPTIVEPFASCSSVIPRGLVHAPHSHTWPPLSMNSRCSSASTGKPGWAIPSVPPSVPSQTASIVQSTTASCPAAAAMFAATNGNVARSASSLPCVQLKISLSLISSSPFHAHQEASVARSLDRTNNVAHHPGERRQVLLRRRIPRAHHEHVADRDLLHAPAELAGEAVGASENARVEAVHAVGLRDGDRPEARAQQVDRCDACVRADVEHQVLLDHLPSVGIIKTEAVDDRLAPLDLSGARGRDLERVGIAEPTSEPADRGVGVGLGHEPARDEHPEPNV